MQINQDDMDIDINITTEQAAIPRQGPQARQRRSATQRSHVAANVANLPNLQAPNLNRRVRRIERRKLYERVPAAFEPYAHQIKEISAEEVTTLCISLVSNHIQLRQALQNQRERRFYKVFDCRYSYEHQGGSIPGAVNVDTPEQAFKIIEAAYKRSRMAANKTSFVFHCEFSTYRGPGL